MTLEDLISSYVYIYVCVVSLITKLFRKFKPISRLKPLRKRRLSYFPKVINQLRMTWKYGDFNPCETEQSRAWERILLYKQRMDETETVVLSVCVTTSQEDMILSQVSQEDMILSHVYIYVCVVSLITNYFRKFKPICVFKPLRKRKFKPISKVVDSSVQQKHVIK